MNGAALMPACSVDPTPRAIRLRTASRLLEVEWLDGALSVWTFVRLRQSCRCAGCEAQRRAGRSPNVAQDIVVLEVVPVGAGALRFTFSDGHSRGIYPFAQLRRMSEPGTATTAAE